MTETDYKLLAQNLADALYELRQRIDNGERIYKWNTVMASVGTALEQWEEIAEQSHNNQNTSAKSGSYNEMIAKGYEMTDDGFWIPKAQERGERIHKETEKLVNKLQEKNWYVDVKTDLKSNWQPTPYTPEQVAQSLREAMKQAINDGVLSSKEDLEKEAENDIKPKNLLRAMDEYFEANKPPTLKELFVEYVRHGDWAQSSDVIANQLVEIVKQWLPPSHPTNSYDWEKCLKLMKEKLR